MLWSQRVEQDTEANVTREICKRLCVLWAQRMSLILPTMRYYYCSFNGCLNIHAISALSGESLLPLFNRQFRVGVSKAGISCIADGHAGRWYTVMCLLMNHLAIDGLNLPVFSYFRYRNCVW